MDPHTHAPYAIIANLVITYGHTTKTACGKRRPTEKLVPRGQQTCEACTIQIQKDNEEFAKLEQAAKDLGLMD